METQNEAITVSKEHMIAITRILVAFEKIGTPEYAIKELLFSLGNDHRELLNEVKS